MYNMTTIISATDLKNRVSEVLNTVYFNGTETIVEKHGKPIARIVPINDKAKKMSKKDIKRALDETFGILPDFPDVTKFRRSRRKTFSL